MKKNPIPPENTAELRSRAAERLKKKRSNRGAEEEGQRTVEETQRLFQELQIHQIELEMQNAELQASHAKVEAGLVLYTDLYDFAPVGYFTLGRDGIIRRVNITGARLFETERTRLVNRRFGFFVSEADRLVFNAFLEKVFASRAKETCEVVLRKEAKSARSPELSGSWYFGETRQFTVYIEAIASEDGQECHVVMADITERKQAEEELRKYSAELIEKNEELRAMTQQLWQAAKLATMGELSASIAHELNNPLAIVSLRIESLINNLPEDSISQRELKIIEQEVERMSNLVANLLQFSRRGQQQLSTVDIREEIEKVLELIYYHLRKRNIVIWREFAKEAPHIQADRQQLQQLFLNLFTNASDAMPQGGTLTIRVAAQPESMQVIVEVADTGMGIPPEILSKMAEPFYSTKPEGKGTGLGLAICRRIMKEHNGTFDIVSEGIPGKGTTVSISLPVKNVKNAAELK
jgi:signal transduction histidine kinase